MGRGPVLVAIALPCKISSGTCSRFMPHLEHLLQSWQMDLSLLGATHMMVAIALPCKISSGMCSRFMPHRLAFAAILADGSVVTWGESR